MTRKLFTFALALFAAANAWAYDFKAGDLYYNITDEAAKTVAVTYEYQWDSNNYSYLPGALDIPATVSYNGINYSVTSIGESAFYYCPALTQVTIPNSVESIGDWAFSYCYALTQVTIPNSVTSIGDAAFYGCSKLTQVSIPNSVTSIEYGAFSGTALYNNADNWTNNVLYINNCLIEAKTELSGSYEITAGTRVIADQAFQYCSALTEITIPNSVTSIGDLAFNYCSALTQVTICNSVTSIGNYAFDSCSKLTQVNIPNSVKSIGSGAFAYCYALTQVNIPNSVKSIGSGAFAYCYALTQVNIPNSVTSIGSGAFAYCYALTAINVESDNTAYCSVDGILFNKDKTMLIQYPAGKPETTYTIPNSVTSIGISAFSSCSALTQITIPESVTEIKDYAFAYCSKLTQVTIPNNVTSIGEAAFGECSALTQVTIGNSVTSIGDYAFYNCYALAEMTVLATIPPTVGTDAFYKVNRDIPVYVPAEALEDYRAADTWKEFYYLQAMPANALQTPSMPESIRVYGGLLHNPQQLHVSLYDMQGRMVYSGTAATVNQPAGVYVVLCAGASRKVLF